MLGADLVEEPEIRLAFVPSMRAVRASARLCEGGLQLGTNVDIQGTGALVLTHL
jgi:hypothetical protein